MGYKPHRENKKGSEHDHHNDSHILLYLYRTVGVYFK